MKVGVRELRNNLSRYLERVHGGAEVVVTEHGRAIAKVVPIGDVGPTSSLDRLIQEGLASPAMSARRWAPTQRIAASAPVSDLVAEQR
jgi:prevent-host-death family protein